LPNCEYCKEHLASSVMLIWRPRSAAFCLHCLNYYPNVPAKMRHCVAAR
jgi:hypothetical protein